jgi:hypothetical protein
MNTTYNIKAKDPVVVIELLDETKFTFKTLTEILSDLAKEFGHRKIMFIDTITTIEENKSDKIIVVFEF